MQFNPTYGLVEILQLPEGVEKAKELAVNGLFTDGGHHKQWYLEQILETLGVDLCTIRNELEAKGMAVYDEGIAP